MRATNKKPAMVTNAAPRQPTPEELQEEMQVRSQTCLDEVNSVLAKHKCAIGVEPFVDGTGLVQARWAVFAK